MLPYLVGIVLFIISTVGSAHPVIYKGGTMLASQNMSSFSDNQINYSFKQNWATGINLWRFNHDHKSAEFGFVRLNHLVKRWNTDNSQANIYLSGGTGYTDTNLNRKGTKSAYLGGIETDWESRTLYTSLKYYHFYSSNLTDISMTQARIGYSPYLEEFDKLQTWVMVQGMYMGQVEKNVTVTPLLRFFYHNVLWEIGSSLRSEWFLNFMVHI
jgi:hypothetical protein